METTNKNEQSVDREYGIDLSVILRHALRYFRHIWPMMIIVILVCAGLFYFKSVKSYRPMYRSDAVFSVCVSSSGATDVMSYSYYYDNAAAKQAVETFPYIINSDVMREKIVFELDKPYINGSISAESLADTNIFKLSVISSDPDDAYDIICAVMDVYPQMSKIVIGDTQFSVSKSPVRPNQPYNSFSWHKNVALGILIGIAIDVVILFALSMVRRTVVTVDDVMKLTSVKCLASIPNVRRKRRGKSESIGLIASEMESEYAYTEAYRRLKLRLLREIKDPEDKVIMVTSSVPSEGKSTITSNLAISLANDGKKVLLIDADLRGQSIKKDLGIKTPSLGLGDYLLGKQSEYSFLRYKDSSLYVFAGDESVNSPTSMLRHSKLKPLFDDLRNSVDYVVIDTPPCSLMADASVFSRYADKVVYVIRSDYASKDQIYDSINAMSEARSNICGFVLNCDQTSHDYSYGSKYGYGYGYGKKNKE